jgi:hypothetical protein
MLKSIFTLLGSALSIWEHENASKYLEKSMKLQKAYDEENDKERPDRNVLDRIERDSLRLAELVSFEIARQKA